MNYLNMNKKELIPVVHELNILLADYNMYYQKLRSYHWNIVGKNFFDLHVKFEELYNDAKIKIDDVAERILTLRNHPVSNFSKYLKISSIKETSALKTDKEMVVNILNDHSILLEQMSTVIKESEKIGDEGTIDMVGAYIGSLEKTSWMLEAWLKNTSEEFETSEMKKMGVTVS
ncbi:Dps family protein [Urechidicola croceus]|uniref:DNA starvation/stationary phase protection protein n=1 Tax=Urechidicola croceus TaxID=1850246 RepID=A0A1D8P416_9FLAO|nr:DNA starvation/stationary phase protection protein [Urechidicola croceus]AOW19308.1 DNA starvation/stationary phase protection protein [Urechidicola croceus]